MISSKSDLKKCLDNEKKLYGINGIKDSIRLGLLYDHDILIWSFVKALRYTEFYCNTNHKWLYYLWERRKNRIGAKLGITIWHNTIAEGLHIWHYGSIIVNGHAQIGKNCQLHGENCIGNKGDTDDQAPVIGNNVDIGVGAKIIGNIYIADDVKIGANAVVVHSCYNKGAVLVGVPAHQIN